MTMKKLATFLGISLLATSCGILDEDPRDQKPESEIVIDATSLYLTTLGNLYSQFGSDETGEGLMGTYRGIYDLNTFTTDEAVIPTRGGDWYDGGLWQRLFLHTWETGEAPLKNSWNYLYKVIVSANQALETLSANKKLLSGDEYLAWTAEVRAVRAMYYYYLCDLFGRVPLVTSTSTAMADVAQSERSEVFAFVKSELEEAESLLHLGRSNSEGEYYGRITQPVAWFLLAKLCLNAEVYLDDDWTDGARASCPDYYAEAVGWCERLTGVYSLEASYPDNFSVFNENSVENILTIPMDMQKYSAQFQYLFRSLHYDHAAACGMSGENGASATLEALEANGFGTTDEDPRFAMNYWGGQAVDLSGAAITLPTGEPLVYKPLSVALDVTGDADEKLAGARMRKYSIDPNGMKDGKLVGNDIVLFRYADVLLMKAEALLRRGEAADEALYLVNMVRARAGAATLGSVSLDDILRERMVEFAWEGWRRQDLVRFGAFTRSWSSRPALDGESSGYTTVFPIPADVLALNPKLTQNPGY